MKTELPRIALSMGDAAGVGPEIILKALVSCRGRDSCRPIIIGSSRVFQSLLSALKPRLELKVVRDIVESPGAGWEAQLLEPDGLPAVLPRPGEIDPAWAAAAMRCVEIGARLALSGRADALVTAPINKEGIHRAGYRYQGHTDFLADLTGSRNYAMMLVGGKIRVVLVTVHVPLGRVSDFLRVEDIAAKIRLAHDAMVALRIRSPRIAVAGLNPHAGEGGAFGREEIDRIRPAVDACRQEGLQVEGPLPPDTLFHQLYHGRYDVAIAMYHDQGLIPLKMIAFEKGVNVTLGLPLVRTSPDHGTAYDIAGKGIADPGSMIAAIRLAVQMARSRAK